MPGIAEIAKPLYKATGGHRNKTLRWDETCEHTFEELKMRVASAVALRIPRDGVPFVFETDASDVGTGAMLAQREGEVV